MIVICAIPVVSESRDYTYITSAGRYSFFLHLTTCTKSCRSGKLETSKVRSRVTRVSRGAVSAEDIGNDVLCARARARKFYYLHLLNATPVGTKVQKFLCFPRFGGQIGKRRSQYEQ